MAEPYLGQIGLFSFTFPPRGYVACDGKQMQISQNQPLFALLGTAFGGDGISTFNLPNLQTRAAMGGVVAGNSVQNMGANGGESQHTLTIGETPQHTHYLQSDSSTQPGSNVATPGGNSIGQSQGAVPGMFNYFLYTRNGASGSQLASAAVGSTGGQPHDNMMPSLGLAYCIAVTGEFPARG